MNRQAAATPRETTQQSQVEHLAPPSWDEVVKTAAPSPGVVERDETYEVPAPPIPLSFAELEGMHVSSLHQLQTDAVAFHSHVNTLPVVKMMQDLRRDGVSSNRRTALATLARQEELATLRRNTIATDLQLRDLSATLTEKIQARKRMERDRYSSSAILQVYLGILPLTARFEY